MSGATFYCQNCSSRPFQPLQEESQYESRVRKKLEVVRVCMRKNGTQPSNMKSGVQLSRGLTSDRHPSSGAQHVQESRDNAVTDFSLES